MLIEVACPGGGDGNTDGSGLREWSIVELQGNLEGAAVLDNLDIGKLKFSKQVSRRVVAVCAVCAVRVWWCKFASTHGEPA